MILRVTHAFFLRVLSTQLTHLKQSSPSLTIVRRFVSICFFAMNNFEFLMFRRSHIFQKSSNSCCVMRRDICKKKQKNARVFFSLSIKQDECYCCRSCYRCYGYRNVFCDRLNLLASCRNSSFFERCNLFVYEWSFRHNWRVLLHIERTDFFADRDA